MVRPAYLRLVSEINTSEDDKVSVHPGLLKELDIKGTFTIGYLIHWQITKPEIETKQNGWFSLQETIIDKDDSLLELLIKKQMIKTKTKNKKKFVWIDYEKIEKIIRHWEEINKKRLDNGWFSVHEAIMITEMIAYEKGDSLSNITDEMRSQSLILLRNLGIIQIEEENGEMWIKYNKRDYLPEPSLN